MPHLAAVTPQPEVSLARRKLADAIAAKATADALFGEAATAVTAASSLLTQEDVARRQLDTMNQRNAESVTEWAKSGGSGKPDIADPVMVATLQHDMTIATANATAARAALPDLQARMESARSASLAERSAVDHAMREVLVDEATEINAQIAVLFDRATALRARLYGLGNQAMRLPQSGTLVASIRRLAEQYVTDPTDAAVSIHQAEWRAPMDKLAVDPNATIKPE